jgi:hypothetical protein
MCVGVYVETRPYHYIQVTEMNELRMILDLAMRHRKEGAVITEKARQSLIGMGRKGKELTGDGHGNGS